MEQIKTYKTNLYEFTPTWAGFDIKYHIAGYFSYKPMLQIYFIWGKLFLNLPWTHYKKIEIEKSIKSKRKDKLNKLITNKKIKKIYRKEHWDECDPPCYGIYYHEHQLGICYGKETKLFDMPWNLDWIRTSAMTVDGKWLHETRKNRNMEFWNDEKWKDQLFTETYPYTYITKDGDVQNCLATIKVQEREWRWTWFKWLKWTQKIRKEIDISFSEEMGERKGSWKGGTTGCSYRMLRDETPYQTLKRMEIERKL